MFSENYLTNIKFTFYLCSNLHIGSEDLHLNF